MTLITCLIPNLKWAGRSWDISCHAVFISVLQGMEMSVDLTDAIGCGKYRFICARIRKNDPEPDYKQVGKDPKATTGCAPVTCEGSCETHKSLLCLVVDACPSKAKSH